jgi:TonB family protein
LISLRDATWLTHASWLAVIVVGFLSFLGVLALRFQRRGADRFWATPAALALCLLPAAVSAAFAALILRDTLSSTALTGSGGMAAVAGGTAEALTPLFLGLAVASMLTAATFLTTAFGSSRSSAPPAGGMTGWLLLACTLLVSILLAATIATILGPAATLNAISGPQPALGARVIVALVGASVLVGLAALLAVVAAFAAPRGPSGLEVKAASLGAIAVCGLMALAGLWATGVRSQRLVETATSGLAEGELPEAHAAGAPPPPPPPRRAGNGIAEGQPVRVGGAIRGPRKIRHVNPVYPDIARQARVQGVVILEATISPAGEVTAVRVLRGIPLLDESALEAVRGWVYEPTLLNGVPVPVIMTITVNFRLSSGLPPSS